METLRTIRLYGKLGARFGRMHRLAVESTAEAIRALCVLVPGFERELMTSHQRGVRYACFLGKQNIGKDDLALTGGVADIRIAPVLAGAKSGGVLQFIVGAVLVVAGLVITGGTFGAASPFGSALISMGISMMVGGVVQMLSPQPKGASSDSVDNGQNYNFSGAINRMAQGGPVPILWGRMEVGSAVISGGIVSQDQAYTGAPLAQPTIPHVLEMFEGT